MTDQEINMAIAEHLGWRELRMSSPFEVSDFGEDEVLLCGLNSRGKLRAVPNYSEDLNAMHEAEKAAFGSSTLWVEFAYNLLTVLQASEMPVADGMTCVLKATAAQRANAFLRTIGKWVEPKGDK